MDVFEQKIAEIEREIADLQRVRSALIAARRGPTVEHSEPHPNKTVTTSAQRKQGPGRGRRSILHRKHEAPVNTAPVAPEEPANEQVTLSPSLMEKLKEAESGPSK